MTTTTTNYGLKKPDINARDWGADMNANLDSLDSLIKANATAAANAASAAATAQSTANAAGSINVADLFPFNVLKNGGEALLPMNLVNRNDVSIGTGALKLMYFTAKRTETITKLAISTGAAAVTSPTLFRLGVYSIDQTTGAGTLLAASASDTTGGGTGNSGSLANLSTRQVRTLTASWSKTAGGKYALAMIAVGSGSPTWEGVFGGVAANNSIQGTTVSASLATQTDLPSTFTDASLSKSTTNFLQFFMY